MIKQRVKTRVNKPVYFIVPLVIYPFDVMVSFEESNEQVATRLSKIGFSMQDIELAMIRNHTVRGRACMFSSNQSLIRMTQKPTTPIGFAQLQHEIFHVATFVMDVVGMEYKTNVSDEAYAYLIQYLTNEIYTKGKLKLTP